MVAYLQRCSGDLGELSQQLERSVHLPQGAEIEKPQKLRFRREIEEQDQVIQEEVSKRINKLCWKKGRKRNSEVR